MSEHPLVCDLCEEGTLEEKQGVNTVTYKSVTRVLRTDYCECDTCGVEMALPYHTRDNKRRMVEFKKEVDGLLTGKEVRSIRVHLGLKQTEAAQIFGGGSVAFSKYEADDVTQSEAMDKLLRVAAELPPAFELLKRKAGVEIDPSVIHQPLWSVVQQAASISHDNELLEKAAENTGQYTVESDKTIPWGECNGC